MTRHLTPEEIELWNKVVNGSLRLQQQKINSPSSTTLIKRTKQQPKKCIDLHGMTIEQAHATTLQFLDFWKDQTKSLVFITGKSGIIRQEFCHWVQNARIEMLNGGGAFRVFLKKKCEFASKK